MTLRVHLTALHSHGVYHGRFPEIVELSNALLAESADSATACRDPPICQNELSGGDL